MLGARLAEKDNHRPHALRAFLDNNVHNNFIAVGMGQQQRLEIKRLRQANETLERELAETQYQNKRQRITQNQEALKHLTRAMQTLQTDPEPSALECHVGEAIDVLFTSMMETRHDMHRTGEWARFERAGQQ